MFSAISDDLFEVEYLHLYYSGRILEFTFSIIMLRLLKLTLALQVLMID